MAKFCPNCGTQLENDAVFCAGCGTKIELEQAPQTETPDNQYDNGYQEPTTPPAPQNKLPKKFITLGIAILAGVLALVLICSIFFPSAKAVTRKYVSGMINGNAKKVVNCMPGFFYEDKDEKQEAIEDLEDTFEYLDLDEYDKIKYEIKDVNKLSKDEREDLESLLELYEKYFDDFDADSVNVKRAKKVEVKITIKDGGDTIRETFEVILIKYKGQWKVLSSDFGW